MPFVTFSRLELDDNIGLRWYVIICEIYEQYSENYFKVNPNYFQWISNALFKKLGDNIVYIIQESSWDLLYCIVYIYIAVCMWIMLDILYMQHHIYTEEVNMKSKVLLYRKHHIIKVKWVLEVIFYWLCFWNWTSQVFFLSLGFISSLLKTFTHHPVLNFKMLQNYAGFHPSVFTSGLERVVCGYRLFSENLFTRKNDGLF